MSNLNGFTPTQRAILQVLSDGLPHRREELHACLPDELGPQRNIRAHITAIRKILRPRGEDVVCEYGRFGFGYRHVRLLANAYDGNS